MKMARSQVMEETLLVPRPMKVEVVYWEDVLGGG